jgi:Domain of unknown function (DUF4262)
VSEDADIAESVSKHGWHAIAVEGTEDSPPFLYTIGLCHTLSHPELIVFGWKADLAHSVVSAMVGDIRKGQVYSEGQRYAGVLEGHDVAVRPVHTTQHLLHFGYAVAYYRRLSGAELLSAVQVFWPDGTGQFPFERACDPRTAQRQPRMELAVLPSELRAFMDEFGSG